MQLSINVDNRHSDNLDGGDLNLEEATLTSEEVTSIKQRESVWLARRATGFGFPVNQLLQ